MKIIEHTICNSIVAEIITDDIVIMNEQDALDLMVNIQYQNKSKTIILYKHNFCDDFYDLKTGVAGSILQKFINYRVRLVILGDFDNTGSKSLNDFIYESNKSKNILFLKDISTALSVIKEETGGESV